MFSYHESDSNNQKEIILLLSYYVKNPVLLKASRLYRLQYRRAHRYALLNILSHCVKQYPLLLQAAVESTENTRCYPLYVIVHARLQSEQSFEYQRFALMDLSASLYKSPSYLID